MAKALMKYETVDEEQLKEVMEGKEPTPPEEWDNHDPPQGLAADADTSKKGGPSVGDRPAEQH